jgi:hypothetical protein
VEDVGATSIPVRRAICAITRDSAHIDGISIRNLASIERNIDQSRFWKLFPGNAVHVNIVRYIIAQAIVQAIDARIAKPASGINHESLHLYFQ